MYLYLETDLFKWTGYTVHLDVNWAEGKWYNSKCIDDDANEKNGDTSIYFLVTSSQLKQSKGFIKVHK